MSDTHVPTYADKKTERHIVPSPPATLLRNNFVRAPATLPMLPLRAVKPGNCVVASFRQREDEAVAQSFCRHLLGRERRSLARARTSRPLHRLSYERLPHRGWASTLYVQEKKESSCSNDVPPGKLCSPSSGLAETHVGSSSAGWRGRTKKLIAPHAPSPRLLTRRCCERVECATPHSILDSVQETLPIEEALCPVAKLPTCSPPVGGG